jgi:cytochrome c biogenesis protein CcmG/thiol:disulfide interchange protein DsbE
VLAGVLLAAVVAVGLLLFRAAGGSGNHVGDAAPQFVSTDLNDRTVSLSSYRGRPVILNFWASWCVPCRTEFPVLHQLLIRHPQVAVLGVVFEDADQPARAFLQSEGATWPGVRDPRSQIADAYDVHAKPGIPVSVLIDSGGTVRAYQYGPFTDEASADAFVAHAGVT